MSHPGIVVCLSSSFFGPSERPQLLDGMEHENAPVLDRSWAESSTRFASNGVRVRYVLVGQAQVPAAERMFVLSLAVGWI